MWLTKRRKIAKLIIYVKRHRKLYASIIDKFILVLIFINSITIGLETYPAVMENYRNTLIWIDRIILAIFILELTLKIVFLRGRFFQNGWNVFDFVIIAISCIHLDGNIPVLRSLRIVRLFLLISFLPKLRFIVESLLNALQGILSIGILLTLIYYVFGVSATHLFGGIYKNDFGSLGKSLFSLFQVMTLDSWSSIVKPIYDENPYSCLFFVAFILLSTYVILNIFIAIIVNGMREARLKNEESERRKQVAEDIAVEDEKMQTRINLVLDKLETIETKIASLEALHVGHKDQITSLNDLN